MILDTLMVAIAVPPVKESPSAGASPVPLRAPCTATDLPEFRQVPRDAWKAAGNFVGTAAEFLARGRAKAEH
jgi:hypothetical protein